MKKRHFIDNDETAPEEGYSIPVMHMEISRSISEESDLSKSDYYLNKSKDEQGAVYVDEKEEVVEEGSCLKLSSKIRRTDIGTNELYEIECHIDLNSLIEHFVDNELNILKTRGLNDDFKSNEAPGADVVEVVLDNFKEIFSDFSSSIRSERKNLADKIERLHQEGYATFIKTSNDPNHTLSQKSLVKMFYDIAKLKYFQAKLTGEAQYCTDAATYCQYAISIANNVNGLFKDKIESSTHIDSIYNLLTKSYHTLINICSLEPKSFEGIKIDSESIKNFSGKNVFETKSQLPI